MNRSLAVKLGLIGLVLLLLLIPLGLLDGLVGERQERGREVTAEIARAVGQAQTVIGPLLLVESIDNEQITQRVSENGFQREVSATRPRSQRVLVTPQRLAIDAKLDSERRHRGPFQALLYHSEQVLEAEFVMPPPPPDAAETGYRVTAVRLLLGLGDHRGIRSLTLRLDGEALSVEPGSMLEGWPAGVSAALPQWPASGQRLLATVQLGLSGSERLAWLPVGDENSVRVQGDWPHPGFDGSPLPRSHDIAANGFRADWQVSRLASTAQHRVAHCLGPEACRIGDDDVVAVRLVEPVDRYLMTDRAIKYALLFLSVIFGAVFFVEVLRGMPVHPMQYALVGLALAIFFLLLLALSEHLDFGLAYLLAAFACLALIGVYMAAVLGSRRRGLAFAGLLALLYGLLYGLLRSEDLALLAGSLALFALLATVMLASRQVDWQRVGHHGPRPSAATHPDRQT